MTRSGMAAPLRLPQLLRQCDFELSARTVQRYLTEFRDVYGLALSSPRRGELALPTVGYRESLSRLGWLPRRKNWGWMRRGCLGFLRERHTCVAERLHI